MKLKRIYIKYKNFFIEWARTLDRGLLWAILALIICGIILAFSASPSVAEHVLSDKDTFHFVRKQLFFLVPSIGIMLGMSMLSPKYIRRLSCIILPVFLLMLICVLLVGDEVKGAKRWLPILGFSLQPSEFIKPVFAVVCAWIFASGQLVKGFHGTLIAGGIYLLVIVLLLLQPDIGMTITISTIWGAQLFLTGISFLWIFGLSLCGITGIGLTYMFFPHFQSRVDRFLNPAVGDHFQIDRSLEALHNAGWFGRGPGEGIIKTKLPDAHTDFILAVAAEEYGFLFCLVIVGLFTFIVVRGFYIMSKEKNLFNMLATAGLLTQFGVQAFINMASTIHLIPTKGMTLPFISCGGSSLISLAFAFGMILSLTRRHPTQGGLE